MIAELDPDTDNEQTMRLVIGSLLPPAGGKFILDLLFTVGLMRVMGQREGAAAVDRDGKGKVHRAGDSRAANTIGHMISWIGHGATAPPTQTSAAEVKRIHNAVAQRYPMSNETFVHTIAFFTVQIECITAIVGAPGFTDIERAAQVRHWQQIGELLGISDIPNDWQGMHQAMHRYEAAPQWFGPSPAAHRVGELMLTQFSRRTFPPGLRWLGPALILSLHEDHVLHALGQPKPPALVTGAVRGGVRLALFVTRELIPDSRTAMKEAQR